MATTSIFPDVPAIVITGSGFDPIVSNNTVSLNNGAAGTVTSATDTQLTVEFSTPPIEAGVLTAVVATTTENSGSAVQVATVVPVITASTANLAANATTMTIAGSGFDTTVANNTVAFNNGAVGTVTNATGTLLTVSLTTGPTAAGPLTATVTTNSVASTANVQVAKVVPVVTSSTASLDADATTMTIAGFGFSTTAANNTVDFDGKAVGTVTIATATQLTVSFSTSPRIAGSLTAIVTTNSVSTTGPVQVASVKPVVTSATSGLAANASTVTINGFGFDTIAGNNTVVFNNSAAGTVTAATSTALTVTFSTKPATAGSLTAVVTTSSVSSGTAVQIATVTPVITSRTVSLSANTTTLTINGFGFDTTAANNVLAFNNGAAGTVSTATATTLSVTFSTNPTTAGSLTAAVTTNSASSGSQVQVATVTPTITSSTTNLAADATSVTINGFGFDTTNANNTVVFNNGAVGSVSAATATALTVTFSVKPATAGSLTAVVTTNSVSTGAAVQVATVTPVVTASTSNLAASASSLTIAGFGFSPVLANNSVALNNGAAGTVTAATPTSLTVTFSTKPAAAGSLTAVVTTNSSNSGTAAQVATVIPVVTSGITSLAADAASLTIAGFGFDTTAANNTVVFNNNAVGTVTTATNTLLTVSLTTKPTSAGSLTAVVTSNSLGSGSAVQFASVIPVITSTTSNSLAANATSLTIDGFGFDVTAANNLVTFNNGAIGTVTAATATQLSVTLSTTPTSAGPLSAVVVSNGAINGSEVQVATITPVVTVLTASLSANATTLTIDGFGFDTTAGDNTVAFNNGAVGTVTAATPTSLTITFSTSPTIVGSLTAVVTTDSLTSGTAVQVATIKPLVTSNTISSIAANATTVTVLGYGFDATAANNSVTLDNGAVGTVSAATTTSLTVTFTTRPTTAGLLRATVTTNTHSSGSLVPIVSVAPVVLLNSGSILSANSNTVTVVGVGFDTTAANNTVVFDSGAVGTVSSATATALTINLSTRPTAGNLKATVTTNSISSGATIQVATVRPIVTSSTSNLGANASTLTINGFGFDPTGSNNTVAFNNGAVGVVTAATPNVLTVTFTTNPTSAGSLTAVVTSNGVASGAATQVASIAHVVTSSTAELAPNANTVTIDGFGFDGTPGNNTVVLNNGAVGTVTSATPNALTVTFSKKPKTAGSLTAAVTSNGISASAVQIASVTPLVLANGAYRLGVDATSLTINGLGFDTTIANNTVAFDNGAVGTVSAATETSLTVTLSTPPTAAGNMNAIVTTNSLSSGSAVQVAVLAPIVTSSTADLGASATELVINGSGFDTTVANNTVAFNEGAVGTVTAATSTALTVTFTTLPANAGTLTAVVTTNSASSGAPVQVASVKPVVTLNDTGLAANATTLVINGVGFSSVASENAVVFNNGAVGTVTASTATTLTATFTTSPTAVGVLTATVTTNGQASGAAIQVANVVPAVTANTDSLAANATSVIIDGFGFSATAANNTVVFNNGAVGTVSSASTTRLTVTFSTKPAAAGSLTAIVTTNSIASSPAVQVASVKPVVTSSTASLSATASTLTINGFGFSTTAGNNTVAFDNGAVGTVTTATATALTVTLGTKPTSAGSLTAVVTTNSQSSGSALQVATVTPLPTVSTTNLAADASTITIAGFGFDSTPSRNTVVFNSNAAGVVTSASPTSITVSFTTKPSVGGSLTATVTSNGVSNPTPIQVATIVPVASPNSAFRQAANAVTLTINGSGFDSTAANNSVVFNNGAVGTVTSATTTSITVTFYTKPVSAGSLTAVVTTNGASNGTAVQVATVNPTVTSSTTIAPIDASTITINGFGFSPTAANNTVVFSNGAAGTVTTATATSLLVTFTTKPTSVGNLTAVVTSNSVSSGTPVQIASVTPVVTSATTSLNINASTVVINGFGFDTTPSRNTVTFNNGASGSVTSATATSLTVTFAVKPTAVGTLRAVVTTNSQSSGTSVPIANAVGVITSSTASKGADESSITINGFGFDSTAANNIITFSNGATGTVTAATSTMLTVAFANRPKAGNLTAAIAINGVSTGSPVQVATIKPLVTVNTANRGANATALTISGFGFDTTAANNTVAFNLGAVGTVTAATATTLTVNLTTLPTSLGNLTAAVTTNSIASGTSVQVARVLPVVTSSTASLSLTATTVVINGFGFDTTAGNNTVVFNNGAAGTVTLATATALTVTFSTAPSAGPLTAIVTRGGVSSASAVQVATLTPVITSSTTSTLANVATLTIAGSGFSTTASNNTVTFNNGAAGIVSAATATSLTVTFTTKPSAGSLTAVVTTNGTASGTTAVQVAAIVPVVTSSTASLGVNGSVLVIRGFGFGPVNASNSVALSGGAVGSVTAASPTMLTINLTTKPTAAGNLTAIVTSNTVSSGAAVQVATVVTAITAPTVTTSTTATQAADAATITITGTNFSTTAANNIVTFNNGAVGAVTSATATSLTVTFSTKPRAGNLTAIVITGGVPSGTTGVLISSITPVVTSSTASHSAGATTLTINGFGFDPTAANNRVTLSNGAVGTIASATLTTLTVTIGTKPTSVGSMTAVVTTNTKVSGSGVQVARVVPSVTVNTTPLAINASSIVISGFAFDSVAGNNTVVFNNGATGTVASATGTTLTVNFGTKPTSVANLTAVVTTSSNSSGAAVQVAAVRPVVTTATSNVGANAATITINGEGFSTTPSNNTVTFSNGAVGTVTAATATALTVTYSTRPTVGVLTALVTTNGVNSGTATQVANVLPVVTSSTASQLQTATSITINGFGFDPTANKNTVTFNNGAVGTVTAATATTLTVNLTTRPRAAGTLTASVVSNLINSGTAVSVASIVPTVTSSTAIQTLNLSTITIAGTGFDTTAANNSVAFSNGAVGTVTTATATLLTVTFSTKPTLGNLTAVVTTNSMSSGDAVQIGIVRPFVTASTSSLALSATTMTINGFGFDTTAANNTVTFNNGAVGTVSSATATALTINFLVKPSTGNLTAVVTVNGASTGTAAQVATLAPTVTAATANFAAGSTTLTISGTGFETTANRNTVVFSNGAVGAVTAATSTQLTVTLSTRPTVGNLTAIVTVNSVNSGTAVQVATVIPSVTLSTSTLAINAGTIVINGFGFDPTASKNTVVFTNGAVGTVTAATATAITVTFATKPTSLGNLTAIVTSNLVSSGSAVQVATVSPVVTSATTTITAATATMQIAGFGFSTTAANNVVVFNNGAVGTVTAATATSLTVSFTTRPSAGILRASVTTDGVSSGANVQIATLLPVVTVNTSSVGANSTTLTISGTGFSTTAANNVVVFNNGAVGTVTAATATSLTVTLSTRPTAGNLTAVVTTNSLGSGAAVQVAAVKPVVTANTTNQARTATTMVINGFGFSTTAGSNTVVFNNGAVGTVTSATATALTVTFSTRPVSTGSLTAVITTSGASSGTPIQVATMT